MNRISCNNTFGAWAIVDRKPKAVHSSGADFTWAKLNGHDFSKAVITGADFEEAHLERADFREAMADRASFRSARLGGAFLCGGSFKDAIFENANLSRAHLSDACFHRANFRNTNLRDTRFRNTDITDIDFTGAKIDGIDLAGIKGNNDWIKCVQVGPKPICYTSELLRVGWVQRPISTWRTDDENLIFGNERHPLLELWRKSKNWIFEMIDLYPAKPTGAEKQEPERMYMTEREKRSSLAIREHCDRETYENYMRYMEARGWR